MGDSQPEGEGVQWLEEQCTGTDSQEGPTAPALLAQTNPFLAFIKENIDVLRTLIIEHGQQTQKKATPKKLTYGDSEEEGSGSLRMKGLLERSSNGSSETVRTQSKTQSKDLSSLALDELIGNLKVHEVVMEKDYEIYRGKKEMVKSIALKAKKESSDDETLTSGSDDE
ncbi:hypothetical protein Tco_0464064 [Tanacetum coccineum]